MRRDVGKVVHESKEDVAVCLFCKSSGVCGKCEGRGVRPAMQGRRKIMVICNACEGSSVCQLCHGTGTVGKPNRSTA